VSENGVGSRCWVAVLSLLIVGGLVGCRLIRTRANATRIGPGTQVMKLTVDGIERSYLVHPPKDGNAKRPWPVVLMLHGGGGTGAATAWETGWEAKADAAGFLVVFPNAVARDPSRPGSFSRNPQLWNDGSDRFYPGQSAVDDVRFIDVLLDDLGERFTVDSDRVFVTGFSNGASMSFLLGAQLSNRIAAIAPVAGACWREPVALQRPVPMLYLTGTEDPLNPIEGGPPKLATGGSDAVRAKPKPPVWKSILRWLRALDLDPVPTRVSEQAGVRTEIYDRSARGQSRSGNVQVVYVSVEGLGHTWAGGRSLLPRWLVGSTSDRVSATDLIWEFFRRQPRSPDMTGR